MLCFIFGAFRTVRTIAQFGSALDWGSRGRGFKSRWSDQESPSFRRFPRHRNDGLFRIQGRSGAMYYGPPPRGMRYGRAPVSLMRGFRPPWDETFRADGATESIKEPLKTDIRRRIHRRRRVDRLRLLSIYEALSEIVSRHQCIPAQEGRHTRHYRVYVILIVTTVWSASIPLAGMAMAATTIIADTTPHILHHAGMRGRPGS